MFKKTCNVKSVGANLWAGYYTTTAFIVRVVTGTVAATPVTIIVVIVVGALESKYCPQADDDSHHNHDVVDHRSNVAANGNGMEGFSGVPLFS